MPARTVADWEVQLRKIVPEPYHGDDSLISGQAGGLAVAEATVDSLYTNGLWGASVSPWVDLHAEGRGISRAAGQTDASLGARLSRYDRKVTPVAIQDTITAMLNEVDPPVSSNDYAILYEHWRDGAICDGSAYCDQMANYGPALILDFADGVTVALSDFYGGNDARYEAWVWAVEEMRPHGCRAYVVVYA